MLNICVKKIFFFLNNNKFLDLISKTRFLDLNSAKDFQYTQFYAIEVDGFLMLAEVFC